MPGANGKEGEVLGGVMGCIGHKCFFVSDIRVSGEALLELLPLATPRGGDWGEGGANSPLFEREREEIAVDAALPFVTADLVSELVDFDLGRPNLGGRPILGTFADENTGGVAPPPLDDLTPPPNKERITMGLEERPDKRALSSDTVGVVDVRTMGLFGTQLLRNEFEGSSEDPDFRLRGTFISRERDDGRQ